MSGPPVTGAAAIHGPEILIPIAFFGMIGTIGFSFTPIGRAIARRLGGGGSDAESTRELRALQHEVDELRAEMETMRARLGEVDEIQGRLDFAERMLASQREKRALPGGR